MAEPPPEAKRLADFERLNRAERRALAHRAKRARRTAFEQWCREHPVPSTKAPSHLTGPTAPAEMCGVYVVEKARRRLPTLTNEPTGTHR